MGILRCIKHQEMDNEQVLRELAIAHATILHDSRREILLNAVKKRTKQHGFSKCGMTMERLPGMYTFLYWYHQYLIQHSINTTEERTQKGVTIDVPTVVEEPQLYLLAPSGSSDAEQGMYNEERSLDLLTLQEKLTTPDGVVITYVLRFFHGDSPAA